jgi:hypothetical protein
MFREKNEYHNKNIGNSTNNHCNSFHRRLCLPAKRESKPATHTHPNTISNPNNITYTYANHIALPASKHNSFTFA